MLKYAKIMDQKTKECQVGLGTDEAFYQSLEMTLMDVTCAYNGRWYLSGFEPQKSYAEKRQEAYPSICEQLDMIYWDSVNGTNHWKEKITQIKQEFPKG